MPSTTDFEFGAVVLVPFPFTDQTTTKKRPAVVVSSSAYHEARPDLIFLAITGQLQGPLGIGEADIAHWQRAGLYKASRFKPLLATIERRLVLRELGRLEESDRQLLRGVLDEILGSELEDIFAS